MSQLLSCSRTVVILSLTFLLAPCRAAEKSPTASPERHPADAAPAGQAQRENGAVKLRSLEWLFHTPEKPLNLLDAAAPEAQWVSPARLTNTHTFTIKLNVDLKATAEPNTFLEIPGVLIVQTRQHDRLDRARQNYPAFPMPDGSVPVLEASLLLHSVEHPDWTNMTIGFPLALLRNPFGPHEIVLHFTGPDWQMFVDGETVDNDFPFGYPQWPEQTRWKLEPKTVRTAKLYRPAIVPTSRPVALPRTAPGIQYWLPHGHNNWVGDVETIFYRGRYHVFYLYDRRHHQSKFGCGAHYFEHLSTADFNSWVEHEAATPLEHQWECIGTGVPFVYHDRLHLAYGLHTTRVYPPEKTSLPAQWDYLKTNGRTRAFHASITNGFPAGATYSVSTDGLEKFTRSKILFHPCENPSVFLDPRGNLRMFANYRSSGTWASDQLDGGWHCLNPGFPPGGDCTIFFRWRAFDYVLGGFTGYWMKKADAPDSAYQDATSLGLDFYDGSNVPAVTEIGNGRFLMAGWIPINGWGGCLLIRELLQFPDGRIGSRWMPEIMPDFGLPTPLTPKIDARSVSFESGTGSFLLSFTVAPAVTNSGRIAVTLLPDAASGQSDGCEFQLLPAQRRAQFAVGSTGGFSAGEKTLREGGAPHSARDYAIENLPGVDQPFRVRMIVKAGRKIGGSLFDIEIAGQRTMISYRPNLAVYRLLFRTEGIVLHNVELSPLRSAWY